MATKTNSRDSAAAHEGDLNAGINAGTTAVADITRQQLASTATTACAMLRVMETHGLLRRCCRRQARSPSSTTTKLQVGPRRYTSRRETGQVFKNERTLIFKNFIGFPVYHSCSVTLFPWFSPFFILM